MLRALYKMLLGLSLSLGLIISSSLYTCAQKPANTDSLTNEIAHAKTDTVRINLLMALSRAYKSGAVAKEFYYANEASALSDKAEWHKGTMYAEQLIGDCYIKVLAYNDAIVHLKRSIEASRKVSREDVERADIQLMVHCYHMLDSFDQAAYYQKLLLDMTAQAGDKVNECYQMGAYALRLSDLERNREAIDYLRKDIALAESRFQGTEQTGLMANLLNTLSTIYVKVGSTDAALDCLRTATILAKGSNNPSLSAYIISSFCDVYTGARIYDSAILYGRQTLELGETLENLDLQQQYARVLSGLYKDTHQPGPALLYHLKYDSLASITNNTKKTIEQAMQVTKIYMEGQAERNKVEKHTLDVARKNQQAALAAALIAMLALTVLTMFIYRSLRQKQRTNRIISQQATDLQQQNDVIDKALKEKEVMLKETHHRIKNNLQLISSLLELQVADMVDEHSKNALRTAQRRIQSIATVHSKLYGSSEDEIIEFSSFATDLFTRLRHAFGSKGKMVRFENTIPVTPLPLNTVVLLGLILNELITNSFKHAFTNIDAPVVGIGLEANGHSYTLSYYDNGPGLSEGSFETQSGSLGLYLVKRMSKQLKGAVNYTFDGGSRFIISFRDAGD